MCVLFLQGGPYYDMLHCLLGAYVCYRPDVGYVQGMSFIAAVLILNLEAADAFICFANLLNRPCHMAFFSLNQTLVSICLTISIQYDSQIHHSWQVWWIPVPTRSKLFDCDYVLASQRVACIL
jgi:hypothetical protein